MLWHIRGSRKRPSLSRLVRWLKPFTHDQLASISPRITGNELGAWQLFACALSLYNFARSTAQHWKQFTSVDCWVLPKNGYNNFTFSHEKQVDDDLLIAWLRSRVHISFRKMQTGTWMSVREWLQKYFQYKKVIYWPICHQLQHLTVLAAHADPLTGTSYGGDAVWTKITKAKNWDHPLTKTESNHALRPILKKT
jgi:hypothetical protein